MIRALLLLMLVSAPVAAQIELTNANCATNGDVGTTPIQPTVPNGHIAWPADDPVWEFDLYRPANRTTINSSGLELRDVRYMGRLVLARASVPVLNVEYDVGGCGCFRDWQTQEAPTELSADATLVSDCGPVSGIVDGQPGTYRTGVSVSAPGAVRTACEANENNSSPGGDVGDFLGVSVEDYGTELVLTGHARAGWYRYRIKWHLYADGRIWPEYSFAAASAICTDTAHRHHAYWRFDFDLDGTASDDVVREVSASGATVVDTEVSRVLNGPSDDTVWSITDPTGIGYRIEPGEADRRLSVDAFSKTDVLVLRYKVDEIDDGLTVTDGDNGCAFAFEPFVDGETLLGEDTVFWYRSGALHEAGNPFECDIVGPTLRPFGFPVTTPPGPGGVEFRPIQPNPSSGDAASWFRVERAQAITAELYDAAGRRLAILFQGDVSGDTWQRIAIDGTDLPTGTYFVRVYGDSVQGTERLVIAR